MSTVELIIEYEDWINAHGLTDIGSADEHLADPRLTREQRDWLAAFCVLWDEAQRREDYAERLARAEAEAGGLP